MATYVRTVVMTMRNLGIQLATPYPAPTATRTRRHQYIQYRFYNPLRDRIEVVPTTRAGINRWIRRQRKFAAANSPISMQHAVPMEQDDALNLAYAMDSTPMGQDDALNLAYAIATTPMFQDMDTTARFSNGISRVRSTDKTLRGSILLLRPPKQ